MQPQAIMRSAENTQQPSEAAGHGEDTSSVAKSKRGGRRRSKPTVSFGTGLVAVPTKGFLGLRQRRP